MSRRLLESGSYRLLEDGTSKRLLEDVTSTTYIYGCDSSPASDAWLGLAADSEAPAAADASLVRLISPDPASQYDLSFASPLDSDASSQSCLAFASSSDQDPATQSGASLASPFDAGVFAVADAACGCPIDSDPAVAADAQWPSASVLDCDPGRLTEMAQVYVPAYATDASSAAETSEFVVIGTLDLYFADAGAVSDASILINLASDDPTGGGTGGQGGTGGTTGAGGGFGMKVFGAEMLVQIGTEQGLPAEGSRASSSDSDSPSITSAALSTLMSPGGPGSGVESQEFPGSSSYAVDSGSAASTSLATLADCESPAGIDTALVTLMMTINVYDVDASSASDPWVVIQLSPDGVAEGDTFIVLESVMSDDSGRGADASYSSASLQAGDESPAADAGLPSYIDTDPLPAADVGEPIQLSAELLAAPDLSFLQPSRQDVDLSAGSGSALEYIPLAPDAGGGSESGVSPTSIYTTDLSSGVGNSWMSSTVWATDSDDKGEIYVVFSICVDTTPAVELSWAQSLLISPATTDVGQDVDNNLQIALSINPTLYRELPLPTVFVGESVPVVADLAATPAPVAAILELLVAPDSALPYALGGDAAREADRPLLGPLDASQAGWAENALEGPLAAEASPVLDAALGGPLAGDAAAAVEDWWLASSIYATDLAREIDANTSPALMVWAVDMGIDPGAEVGGLIGGVSDIQLAPIPLDVNDSGLYNWWSDLLAFVNQTGIFGAASVNYAIDPEAEFADIFPVLPLPYCVIKPGRLVNTGWDGGGGRFVKTWTVSYTLIVVVRNVLDPSYRSTAAVTASRAVVGPYVLADEVVNLMEQGYVTDPDGRLASVDLPVCRRIGKPKRFASNEYIYLELDFEVTLCQDSTGVLAPVGGDGQPPGPQLTTLADFFPSLLAAIAATGVFGVASVDYAIDAEAAMGGLFPVAPPPYALVQPGDMQDSGDEGRGRYGKVWTISFEVVLIVRHTLDPSYHATAAVTSDNPRIGIYALADQTINAIEQAYVTDTPGFAQLVELLEATGVGEPVRLKAGDEYIMITISFICTLAHSLPAPLP